MMNELDPGSEKVTAVLTSHLDSGENYDGAILIGVYPDNRTEIWLESREGRVNVQCSDVDAFCKQLKRAKKIAQEQTEE